MKGGYYYYKNGKTGLYWGRCMAGSSNYELLRPDLLDAQKRDLERLDENDFEPQGRMTRVPEMQPQTPIIPPPSDPTPNGQPEE
jgi:hypothetical protein